MTNDYIRTCDTCQKQKTGGRRNHGLIPLAGALRDKNAWEKIMVDCAGSWKIRVKLGTSETTTLTFHVCSMINSGAGWVEFGAITSASGKNVSKAWRNIGYSANQGQLNVATTTALSLCARNFKNFYPGIIVIKSKPTTIKNPQAQALVERMRHSMVNQ